MIYFTEPAALLHSIMNGYVEGLLDLDFLQFVFPGKSPSVCTGIK